MADFPFPNATQDLSGEVALVTGATSGLGWHFARVLAHAGAKVAICGRREKNLIELHKIITEEGGQCAYFLLDMMDADNIVNVVKKTEEQFGSVTILLNNAGIPDAQLATQMSVELIDQVLSVNVRGPFILAREVAKRLIKQKLPGRIVNISSIAAFNYLGNGASLYSISKAAVVRMTETLAVEWARFGVNVNAIAPGVVKSEMSDGMIERMGDLSQHMPRKRIAYPPQLDSTLLYLCSPSSECVTGTVIKVDDGQMQR